MIKIIFCDVAAVHRVNIFPIRIIWERGFVYEYKCFQNTNFRSYTKVNRVNRSYTNLIRMSL